MLFIDKSTFNWLNLQEVAKKAAERERKKAEVRKRLEEEGKKGKKAKKGFLTPERKKKLRVIQLLFIVYECISIKCI